MSLIDIAIAVQGVNTELTRWIANISREGLTRAFLVWEPEALDESDIVALELEKFDIILAPTPIARLPSLAVQPSLAEQDLIDDIDLALAGPLSDNLADATLRRQPSSAISPRASVEREPYCDLRESQFANCLSTAS